MTSVAKSIAAQNSHHGVNGVIDRAVVDQGLHIISFDRKGAVEPFFLIVRCFPTPFGEPLLQQCGRGIDMDDATRGKFSRASAMTPRETLAMTQRPSSSAFEISRGTP